MSVEATSKTIRSYLDALVARGDFADCFTTTSAGPRSAAVRNCTAEGPVRDFLSWMHTQAFNAPTQDQDPGRWRWASSPGGRLRRHPHQRVSWNAGQREVGAGAYCVVYDLQHEKIAALRAYIPMDLFAQQLQ